MLCVEGTDGGESHEAGTLADHESMAVVAWGSGDDGGVSPPSASFDDGFACFISFSIPQSTHFLPCKTHGLHCSSLYFLCLQINAELPRPKSAG